MTASLPGGKPTKQKDRPKAISAFAIRLNV
jgi:hypothetical protein